MKQTLAVTGIFLALAVACVRRGSAMPDESAYRTAFVDVHGHLNVFPFVGEALSIPLPINLGRMTYGPDGRSLYGFDGSLEQPRRGLLRIEFNPVRVTSVPGSEGLRMVNGFSVSPAQDKVALSSSVQNRKLFELWHLRVQHSKRSGEAGR